MYSAIISPNVTPISENTVFAPMYRSVRFSVSIGGVPWRSSPSARPRLDVRFLRMWNSVYAEPTIIPPTAMGLTM
jgi:hypothetical protein